MKTEVSRVENLLPFSLDASHLCPSDVTSRIQLDGHPRKGQRVSDPPRPPKLVCISVIVGKVISVQVLNLYHIVEEIGGDVTGYLGSNDYGVSSREAQQVAGMI